MMHHGALLLQSSVLRNPIPSDASCIRQQLPKDGNLLLTTLQQHKASLRSASFQGASVLSLGWCNRRSSCNGREVFGLPALRPRPP